MAEANRNKFQDIAPRHDVRFGSQADMCVAKSDVRFTPNSDRESGHPQTVRFTPESGHVRCNGSCLLWANSGHRAIHSITLSARASSAGGTVRPSAFAALTLIISSNLVGCSTGKSAGLAPLNILSTYVAARRHMSVWLGP